MEQTGMGYECKPEDLKSNVAYPSWENAAKRSKWADFMFVECGSCNLAWRPPPDLALSGRTLQCPICLSAMQTGIYAKNNDNGPCPPAPTAND